jgi:hypothetical protein
MNYLALRTRTQYLRGEEDVAGDTVINSHIQYAILDILNKYPFSWAKTTTSQASNANLPANINPKWGISVNDGTNEWTQVSPEQSYLYSNGEMVFWITYVSDRFYLNTPSTETLNVTYSINPTALALDADVCIIPDGEAVAYLAAAKMYIGDERNADLKAVYEKDADIRIQSLISSDSMFGPILTEGSALDYNSQITEA